MPIEIKELHIKVEVSPSGGKAPGAVSPPGASGGGAGGAGGKDEIIAECVEQVLTILQNKRER